MSRLLGIDLGSVRVGLAVTDPDRIIASPFKVLNFVSSKELVKEITDICRNMDVAEVVIGLPLREDGTEGPGCKNARELASLLKDTQGIKAELWDERYSSRIAESYMREMGIKQEKSRKYLDSVAASLILENYMKYRDKKQ